MTDAFILSAARTPIGKFLGGLAELPAPALGAIALRATLERAGVSADQIDEVLLETPWAGQEWWNNNVLEVELFNTRLCNEQFYVKAQEASTLTRRDALEVFYVCVVLGFRGLYREPTLAAMLTEAHGLPPDLETWSEQTALAIRLGQGRPTLTQWGPELAGAPPRRARQFVAWSWLAAATLSTAAVIYYVLYFRGA